MKKILFVLSLFITGNVFADACSTALMGPFTAAQSSEICTTFGDGIIPLDNNTYLYGKDSAGVLTGLLKIDGSNETVLNTSSGDGFLFTLNGTAAMTISSAGGVSLNTAGQTLTLPSTGGGGACAGTFVCNGATAVTITTSCISTSSVVVYGINTVGGTPAASPYMFAITNGVSFQVKCAAGDTSTMNYSILKIS